MSASSESPTAVGEKAAPSPDAGGGPRRDDRNWWRSTWPIDRSQWVRFSAALVGTIGVFVAIGLVTTDLTAPNAITRLDADVAERLVASRTAARNDLAEWGSFVASTPVKIGLTALVAIVALVAFKRWHETVFVALTLVFEATVFIVVTFVVARPRPDVVRLQDSPVTSSFPSGHVAAATVYGAFVIVVAWHTRSAWKRAGSAAAVAAIVVLVGWSRAYQGMHHLSDVVMGVVLGVWSLVLCRLVMGAPPHGQRIRRFTPVRVRHGR